MKLVIDYQCPQCGAPAVLEETDRLFSCQYCRVRSYLSHKDYFQYVLPSNASTGKNLFFVPYWRFKGMLFSCIDNTIEHKFLDVSQQAIKSELFPVSMGLRSQALKLRFVSPDMKGYFIKPKLSFQNAIRTCMNHFFSSSSGAIQHQTHVGETVSIIYSPFYADTKLYDAVLDKVVKTKLPNDFDLLNFPGGEPTWSLNFIPTLCPRCGWDLKGARNALALICSNCTSIWIPVSNKLKELKFGFLSPSTNTDVYFPFWRIKGDISGIPLKSYADLVSIANLPKSIQKGWDKIDFYFWIPGFKVSPKTFLRLLIQTTLSQPAGELNTQFPTNRISPVTLSVEEAAQTLKITLLSIIMNESFLDNVSDIEIKPRSILLAFIPFQEDSHDYVQPTYHIAINKNQLSLSNNL